MTEDDASTVRSVMVAPPIVVEGLATVTHAIALMHEHQISSLVVDKRHDGDEYGLLVVTDIASKIIGADRAPQRTNVYEIMSKPVLKVDIDMGLRYAVRLLDRFGVSRALVMKNDELAGLVTMRDMVLRYTSTAGP